MCRVLAVAEGNDGVEEEAMKLSGSLMPWKVWAAMASQPHLEGKILESRTS